VPQSPTSPSPPALNLAGKPNILIILTDDERLHGGIEALPAVRKWFGQGGTTFTDPFATTPLCCPSRAALLTGEYAHNSKVISNTQDLPTLQAVQSLTMEHSLQTAGYRTGIFGKYFNGWPDDQNPAYFDRWAVTPHVTYNGAQWNVNGTVRTVDTYSTTYIQQRANAFLAQSKAAHPWFLYLAPMAPHVPSTPEPRFANASFPPMPLDPSMTEQDRSDKPTYASDRALKLPGNIQHHRLAMLRSLMSVNTLVSSVMNQLKAKGEFDNTLAFFASDNGYLWGEHGLFGKASPYLPSVNVPLFMEWPGHVKAGAVDGRLVALLDVAPTVFAAVGLTPPHPMDGIDLLHRDQARTEILLEFWSYGGSSPPNWSAVLTKSYEYIEYTDASGKVIFSEYYDLVADPYQLNNLLAGTASSNRPDVTALSAELARLRTCVGATCPK
jgi:arylsulfatase A-like enzyme